MTARIETIVAIFRVGVLDWGRLVPNAMRTIIYRRVVREMVRKGLGGMQFRVGDSVVAPFRRVCATRMRG